jgi:hypothetical protein
MSMLDRGLSIDHAHPKRERRYLARSSLRVRFQRRLRERRSSSRC